jgi:transposase
MEVPPMHYVGVDLHKEMSWFYVMDSHGRKLSSLSISNKPERLKQFLGKIPTPFTLAVEATYNWYFFVDLAEQFAEKVLLADSFELKAFAKRHKKTDKIDARLIADVLRKGYLPSVFIPNQEIRTMKELLRYRINLVQDRSRYIFRLKNTLDRLGANSAGDFTTAKRLHLIPIDSFPPEYETIISGYIARIVDLSKNIHTMKTYLRDSYQQDTDIRNLITLDGLDYFSAALIKSEIGDIHRFNSFGRLCAYAGLAPKVSQSGSTSARHGALMSNRRKYLQWILLETVFHYIKASAQRQVRYEYLKRRKCANTAKVIFARQMLKIIYHILKEQRPYYTDTSSIQSVAAPALGGV